MTRKEHFHDGHDGNWKNEASGEFIDRQSMIDKATSAANIQNGDIP